MKMGALLQFIFISWIGVDAKQLAEVVRFDNNLEERKVRAIQHSLSARKRAPQFKILTTKCTN